MILLSAARPSSRRHVQDVLEGTSGAVQNKIPLMIVPMAAGVVGILGSTYTGDFEDIKGIDTAIEALNKKKGWDIKIHVDGASGAFVAPFAYPDLQWDFSLKNVVSINASGHK